MSPTTYFSVTKADIDRLVDRLKTELAPKQPPTLVKLADGAKQLGISRKTVQRRVEAKRWPHYRDGHTILIDVQEIRTLLRVERDGPTTPHFTQGARHVESQSD